MYCTHNTSVTLFVLTAVVYTLVSLSAFLAAVVVANVDIVNARRSLLFVHMCYTCTLSLPCSSDSNCR